MAPFASGNSPISSSAPNEPVPVMQDPNGPWTMDLNTSVTIIFGILGLIFQAGQICYGRRQITRTSMQSGAAQNAEIVFTIPDAPMSQRRQTRPFHGSRGSSRSMHPQQRSPAVETTSTRHPQQPDRMFGRCTQPLSPDTIRRRHAPHYPNRGQRGGAAGFSDRARHLPQYNNNQNAQYRGQGVDVSRVC